MTPPRTISATDIVAGLPDFLLAGGFLLTWVAPDVLGVGRIADSFLLMLLEFIVIHSAAFMGLTLMGHAPARAKIKSVLGFGVFYSLFAGGFALGFKAWWPLAAFWILIANRLLGGLLGGRPSEDERDYVRAGWGAAAAFYLVGIFITVLLPIPELGVTSMVRRAADLPGSGVWVSEPHRMLAFGFLYFTATGTSELFGHRLFLKGLPKQTGGQ